MTRKAWRQVALLVTVFIGLAGRPFAAEPQIAPPPGARPQTAAPVERLGPDRLRVGSVQIDTAKKEISVRGVVNDVTVLEFLANTKGGFKAYESALELDTNAISFNLALILIGLDPAHGVAPKFQFDPSSPQGDAVEIWVEWQDGSTRRTVRAEELVYNEQTKQTLPEGPWVYTGSVFMKETNAYLADIDGTLIGFMHVPSPIIENPKPLPGSYGAMKPNPNLNLKPGTEVVLRVRAIGAAK